MYVTYQHVKLTINR